MSIIENKSRQIRLSDRDDEENSVRLKSTARGNNDTLTHPKRNKSPKRKNGRQKNSCDLSKKADKQKPTKSLVRNTELRMPENTVVTCPVRKGILKNPLISTDEKPEDKEEKSPNFSYCRSRFSSPELYSSLNTAKKISAAKLEKIKPINQTTQMINEKAANKLNFPLEEQVYRDLVALNVTDEDLLKEAEKHTMRDFESTRRDMEPKLEEFHKPNPGTEYTSISKPLPCSIEKVKRYNGHSIYNKTLMWENLAQQ